MSLQPLRWATGLVASSKPTIGVVIQAQPIQAEYPEKPSLARLDAELLLLITEHLGALSGQSLKHLALVCSLLYKAARYVQYRSLSFFISETFPLDLGQGMLPDYCRLQRHVKLLQSIIDNGFLPAVRELNVYVSWDMHVYIPDKLKTSPLSYSVDSDMSEGPELACLAWHQLKDAIPKMTGLRSLCWGCSAMPDFLLDFLRDKKPPVQVKLSLMSLGRYDLIASSNDKYEEHRMYKLLQLLPDTLRRSELLSNITSLCIKCSDLNADDIRSLTQGPIKQLLLGCCRLRELSIDIKIALPYYSSALRRTKRWPRNWARDLYRPDSGYCGFGFQPGEVFQPLEALSIVTYGWGYLLPDGSYERNASTEGLTSEALYWKSYFNWSLLRSLSFYESQIRHFVSFAPHLTALNKLEIVSVWDHEELVVRESVKQSLKEFLVSLPPSVRLKAFSLGWSPLSDPELMTHLKLHACTLCSLTILRMPARRKDVVVSQAELVTLRNSFPNLHTLALAIYRDPKDEPASSSPSTGRGNSLEDFCSWPFESLDVIASFPRLKVLRLQLWMEYDRNTFLRPPYLTYTTAGELTTYLCQRSANPHGLGEVLLYAYPVVRRPGSPDQGDTEFEWLNEMGFRVIPGHQPDAQHEITCLKLGKRMNRGLKEVALGRREMTEEEMGCPEFLIALKGSLHMHDAYRLGLLERPMAFVSDDFWTQYATFV